MAPKEASVTHPASCVLSSFAYLQREEMHRLVRGSFYHQQNEVHATASAINESIILPLQSIQFRRVNPEGRTGGMRVSRRAFCLLCQADRRGPNPPPNPTPPLLAKITHATLLLLPPRLVGFTSHPLSHPQVNVICQAGAARCGHNGRIVEVDQSASLASAPSFPTMHAHTTNG